MPPTKPQSDEGASPIIGAIFVLAFSVVSVLVTLYWGLPIIDEMKAVSEFKGVGNQFTDLQAQIQDLASGSAVNTAKRWDPALNRGVVTVREGTHRVALQADQHQVNRVYLKDAMNNSTSITLGLPASTPSWNNSGDYLYVEAYRISAGEETELTVSTDAPAAMTPKGDAIIKGAWNTYELSLSNGNDYYLANNLTKLVLQKQKDADCAEASPNECEYEDLATIWIFDQGEIEYRLEAGETQREIRAVNTATLKGSADALYVSNDPPAFTVNTDDATAPRLFARAIQLTGGGSFGGDAQFRLVLTLRSTSLLASDVTSYGMKLYYGDTATNDAWMDHLVDDDNDYGFDDQRYAEQILFGSDYADNFVEHWVGSSFSFTFVHSHIVAGGE